MEQRYNFAMNGLSYSFVFDPELDDPAEGATLTGVFDSESGQRVSPSALAESVAYARANEHFGLPRMWPQRSPEERIAEDARRSVKHSQ